ncbi:LamG domain-containing protein [Kitasatospora cathayae]|uniref:LamG domain-containing protein n=1 Tax=Kitasatospora cathayae TaxID=3004092 RepID=A0ABY7PW57_9ACTN|nr:LamG domain-containing protein [Kitasatospora sp. HUAS 3-15]WBP84601.1 LamG domain-containing protein [Kitasatospora sp. HUAS 3-15]
MNRQRRPGHALSRPLAAAAALLVASAVPLPSAVADAPATRPSPSAVAAADAQHRKDIPEADEAGRAIAKAKATHQDVPIDSLTTESSETVATPEGHLRLTSHPEQQRVKRSGTWTTLDAGLAANPDGTFSPKASVAPLVLSKGGDGPLATLTDADGKKLSVTAPFRLPAPTVSGDSLLYPSVAPDTDLKVTATRAGGLRTVLIVKTQAAAASPQLAKLHFDVAGDGISVSGDKDGNLVAKSADGKARWASAAPSMWDSSTTAGGARPRTTDASPADSAPAAGTAAHEVSDPAAPGRSAKVAQMPATASAKGIDLAPDRDLLTHGTAPYYIDPDFQPVTANSYAYTWVQSSHSTPNWMHTGPNDSDYPGVGLCGYYAAGGSCSPTDIERSFYQFNVSGLTGAVIGSATVNLQEYSSASWSCGTTYPLSLYQTGPIDGNTVWSNQPSQISGSLGTDQVPGSGHTGCYPNVPFSYTATSAVQSNANANNGTITFGVYGNESDANGLKRLAYQPSLAVTYDRTPNVPTNEAISPSPRTVSPSATNQACDSSPMSSWGWLGAGSDQANAVSLTATVSSSVQQQLWGQGSVWDDSVSGSPNVFWGQTGLTANNGTAVATLPAGTLKDGHAYGWYMYAFDGVSGVPWSGPGAVCHFRVDLTPPQLAYTAVTDPTKQFVPSGSGQAQQIYVGQQGYIPFTATDPAPSGFDSSGVACVRYGWDPQIADGPWQCGSSMPGGQLPVTPSHWGTNIVYAQAEDNAGNLSPIAAYSFYVPWNPNGKPPVFGDVTGDGVPKIVTPDTAGNLRAYTVPGNQTETTAPPAVLSAKPANTPNYNAANPGADPWSGYQTTHRGSLTGGKNVDDLIVHKPGDKNLYWYPNAPANNTGVPGVLDNHTALTKPACDPTVATSGGGTAAPCTGYASDWSSVLEIAASGDPLHTDLNAGTFYDRTGLFTIETGPDGDGALWFYPAVGDGVLGSPTNLGYTGWKGWNLISPGDWSGQGHPGLWARNNWSGDVRGYNFNTGNITVTGKSGATATFPTFTGLVSNTLIGCGVTGASYPLVGSDGDLTGSGHPTLWAITPSHDVRIWTGYPNSPVTGSTCNPGYTWTATNVVLNTGFGADRWQLTAASTNNGVATDTSGLSPATIYGNVGWTTGRNNTANGAAKFTSGSGYLRTSAPVVDTAQSYTVSAWVNLTSTPTADQTILAEGGTNHQAFYLWFNAEGGANNSNWGVSATTSDNPSTSWVGTVAKGNATLGWSLVTATYSVDTHVLTLYVNGQYAGSVSHTSPWHAPNGLSIGASAGNGLDTTGYNNFTSGAITDVRTYPYALTADEVNKLYTTT